MTRDERRELLTHGEVEIEGLISSSSNHAMLTTVTLNGLSAQACYKPEAGERPLWDFPDGLWRREIAASILDEELGLGLVPLTIGRDDLPYGQGSLQWWVDDDEGDHYFTLRDRPEFQSWFEALAAFDVVANNADRKSGHVLFDGQRCWAIDNGLCFHEEEKLRTVIWEFAGRDLRSDLVATFETFAHRDYSALEEWLAPHEVVATKERALVLVQNASLPLPDEEREWPPYPWPLI
jgi:uncharacterized repeat protein (TIGR03843 family)